MTDPQDQSLQEAAQALASAHRVAVLTGAGVSAESKIPTFRDAAAGMLEQDDPHGNMKALWQEFDPMTLATAEAFNANPELVSRWYDWRRLKCHAAEPNLGHTALARLEQELNAKGSHFLLITQNVDGLHQRAGNKQVTELHGSLAIWRCTVSGKEQELGPDPLPHYPMPTHAGGYLRPGVVWFGEQLPQQAIDAATQAAIECDVFIIVGTSSVVYPAAGLTDLAKQSGAETIEINPDITPASSVVDWPLNGSSGLLLPRLIHAAFAN